MLGIYSNSEGAGVLENASNEMWREVCAKWGKCFFNEKDKRKGGFRWVVHTGGNIGDSAPGK